MSSEEGDPEKENEKEDLDAELKALLEESTTDLPRFGRGKTQNNEELVFIEITSLR